MTESKERTRLFRTALALCVFTISYNVVEGFFSILFGFRAGSASLIGFGLDSVIESLSGGVMVWRILRRDRTVQTNDERIEQLATRFVAVTFFILAAYVSWESVAKLIHAEKPAVSIGGIVITAFSLAIMPVLSFLKFRTAKALRSRSLAADAKETLVCSFLSFALLLGLGANAVFGFWQADPLAGLVIAGFLVKEGLHEWKGCGDSCGKD